MKSFKLIAVVLSITLSVLASDLPGSKENPVADCAYVAPKDAYKKSKAVFVGKIIGVVENGDSKIYEFRVEKYWKGVKGKKINIITGNTMRFEPNYQKGKSYLIYAYADDKGLLRVGKCTRGFQLEFAKEDLKILGKAKIPR